MNDGSSPRQKTVMDQLDELDKGLMRLNEHLTEIRCFVGAPDPFEPTTERPKEHEGNLHGRLAEQLSHVSRLVDSARSTQRQLTGGAADGPQRVG